VSGRKFQECGLRQAQSSRSWNAEGGKKGEVEGIRSEKSGTASKAEAPGHKDQTFVLIQFPIPHFQFRIQMHL